MAYQMQADGMEEISEILSKLEDEAQGIAARGLYDGAGVMADAIKREAANIKTAPFKYAKNGSTRLPSPEEKEIVLQAAAGIARFNKNGAEVDTSVGFQNAGYAQLKNKTVPVPVVVNAINSGTGFMEKQPFVRKAEKAGRAKAMQAMKASIERDFDAITK